VAPTLRPDAPSRSVSEQIELTLNPYEATVIHVSEAELSESLSGPWQVAYGNEPAKPVDLPHIWEDEPGQQHRMQDLDRAMESVRSGLLRAPMLVVSE
jgi:hypothetical protein